MAKKPDAQAGDSQAWTRWDLLSLFLTLALVVTAILVAANTKRPIVLAASVGGLGGLVHELAQTQGTLIIPRKRSDGLYLGTTVGLVLGSVAGVLAVQGRLEGGDATISYALGFTAFLAGLALKGVAEAAVGNRPAT